MTLRLQPRELTAPQQLSWSLPSSKSLTARRLLLHALEEGGALLPLELDADTPEDIRVLVSALEAHRRGEPVIHVGASGTAMRFLTAYLAATTPYPLCLEGADRQHERPIAPLVTALRGAGADITYLEAEGFPPLAIAPARLEGELLELDASSSSQYLSALLLLSPRLSPGCCIELGNKPLASAPYAAMTLQLLGEAGYRWQQEGTCYHYLGKVRGARSAQPLRDEADWSAASYAYVLTKLLPLGSSCFLSRLRYPSLQGDSEALLGRFALLGVQSEVQEEGILLRHKAAPSIREMRWEFNSCPDLVPSFAVLGCALGLPFHFTGVAHLRLKESDRLMALVTELAKLGYSLELAVDSLSYDGRPTKLTAGAPLPTLATYRDHRMAMALALLALKHPGLGIADAEVVAKSFPSYWQQLNPVLQLR